jgi:hypothetical protein
MSAVTTNKADRKEHAARINAAWQRGVEAIIETGLRIIDAREALEHGEYIAMVENDLHCSRTTAFKLVAVASNKTLSNVSHVKHLPSSWGTLYELASAENKGLDLGAGIKSGAIHPKMERKDVKALLPPPAQRDDDLEEGDDMPTREEAEESYQATLRDLGEPYDHQSPWAAHNQQPPDAEDDGDSPEVIWRRGLLYRAEEAAGSALYEDWSQFRVDSELVAAAERAAEAWGKTAAYLRELGGGMANAVAAKTTPEDATESGPKRRGRPPGSKNKPKIAALIDNKLDETIEMVAPTVAVDDDFSDTLAARMQQGESTGAPDDPYEIPAMFDRTRSAS